MTAASASAHVLVVDDNTDATEVLALLIETEQCTAATARTVAEARQAWRAQRPDLVLLDVQLPDGSGLDWLAELQAGGALSDTRVVVLSGALDTAAQTRALALGAAETRLKPLGLDELQQVLGSVRR